MRPFVIQTVISVLLAVALLTVSPAKVRGQDVGVPIEPERVAMADAGIIDAAEKLRQAGKLMDADRVREAMKSPRPEKLVLPKASDQALAARDIAVRARQGMLRVGWLTRGGKSKHWRINVAGGYLLTTDGVAATACHVITPDKTARESYLIAIDSQGKVLPVTSILASDVGMDAAIIRVAGGKFTPLPLNDRVAPGDAVYLYSDPMRVSGYFSSGIVNRFYWRRNARHADAATLPAARDCRMNVSTDWAPGSSGAPVVDAFANVVGHVTTIAFLQERARADSGRGPAEGEGAGRDGTPPGDGKVNAPVSVPGPTMITLHEAVPARGVRLLAESLVDAGEKKEAKSPSDAPSKVGR